MAACVVFECTNNSLESDDSIKYYPFPKGKTLVQQWTQACGWPQDSLDVDNAHVCSIHFDKNAFTTEIKLLDFVTCYTKILKNDAVPTLHLPESEIVIEDEPVDMEIGDKLEMIVYTTEETNEDNITSITLNDSLSPEIIYLKPSTSEEKVEQHVELSTLEKNEKYEKIKSYSELYALQAYNESLKRKMEDLQRDLEQQRKELKKQEEEYQNYEKICKNIRLKMPQKSEQSQQEQRRLLSKVFSESQIKILFGKKKIYWSSHDMAVGYTIRHLSNKRFYLYLTKNLNIPFPAISSIKRWLIYSKSKKSKMSEDVRVAVEKVLPPLE